MEVLKANTVPGDRQSYRMPDMQWREFNKAQLHEKLVEVEYPPDFQIGSVQIARVKPFLIM